MKGFKDKNKKFHPISNKKRMKRMPSKDMLTPTGGVKVFHTSKFDNEGYRLKRNDAELNVDSPLNESTTARRTKAMLMKLEMKDPVLTEKEINWMKNNINGSFAGSGGKTNEFGMKVEEIINNREGGYKITADQNQKGLDWLKKKPQQNMMGFREKDIVDNFEDYRLDSFYDAGNSFRSFNVPLWKVRAKPEKDGGRGTMLYYNSGGMQIIG